MSHTYEHYWSHLLSTTRVTLWALLKWPSEHYWSDVLSTIDVRFLQRASSRRANIHTLESFAWNVFTEFVAQTWRFTSWWSLYNWCWIFSNGVQSGSCHMFSKQDTIVLFKFVACILSAAGRLIHSVVQKSPVYRSVMRIIVLVPGISWSSIAFYLL